MKKVQQILKNKKGDGNVFTILLLLLLTVIFFAVITYCGVVTQLRVIKNNVRVALDNYVIDNSVQIYSSVKNGNELVDEIDENYYHGNLAKELSSSQDVDTLTYKRDGRDIYIVSKPVLTVNNDEAEKLLKISADFTVDIPIYFFGLQALNITTPLSVKADYLYKFE